MTYRQFRNWCNDRAADGCWGFFEAEYCITLIKLVDLIPFWKRRKFWNKIEPEVMEHIVNPTNQKIQDVMNPWTEDLFAGYKFEED